MTNPTNPFNWQMPTASDLVTDLPADFETFGQAVATSMADLLGGTTGQVLSKASNTDMDFTWVTSDDANAIQNAIVDAKGDLIAASAADTPARLAVGNNGETLVADSSTATGLRYQGTMAAGKNAIINGGFDIWQRGTTGTFNGAAFTYTADRWVNVCTGFAPTCTVSRQTADTAGLQYGLRFGRNSGQTNTGSPCLVTVLETAQSIPYAGKTITFSFYAKNGANAPTNSLTPSITYGTGSDQSVAGLFAGSWTGQTSLYNTAVTTSTTMTRFSVTVAVPSTATQLAFNLYYGPSGTAGANEWYQIEGVQVEIGSVATNFTRAGGTIQGELAACQRYYQRLDAATAEPLSANGGSLTTTISQVEVVYPVVMRSAPSSLDSSNVEILNYANNTSYSGGTLAINLSTKSAMQLRYTHGSAVFTAGNVVHFRSGSGTGYIGWSAEL